MKTLEPNRQRRRIAQLQTYQEMAVNLNRQAKQLGHLPKKQTKGPECISWTIASCVICKSGLYGNATRQMLLLLQEH